MDAVDPEVDVAFGREIALAPARVLVRPGLLEPPDGRGREPAGILAEQCHQRLLEIAGGDALQVEDRDQHLQALRPARVGRQNRRREADALATPSPTRSRTRGQRTATGPMPVMISRSGRCPWRTSRRRPSSVSLSAWLLSKAATSASTACASSARAPLRKTSVSGSVNVPGWNELENVSLGHGVSLLRWRSGGVEHPHDTPPYPFMPSPTFAHSSRNMRGFVFVDSAPPLDRAARWNGSSLRN